MIRKQIWGVVLLLVVFIHLGTDHCLATQVSFTRGAICQYVWNEATGRFEYTYHHSPYTATGGDIEVEYGTNSWFMVQGGWGVDTPYMQHSIRFEGINPDDLYVYTFARILDSGDWQTLEWPVVASGVTSLSTEDPKAKVIPIQADFMIGRTLGVWVLVSGSPLCERTLVD